MELRISLLNLWHEDEEAALRLSIQNNTPVIKVLVNGQPRWGVLEQTYSEGSAEGPSWKPVEVC